MGNLHRVQSAVQTSEDFASEVPRLLLLQVSSWTLSATQQQCLALLNLLWPGLKHYILSRFHKQVRDEQQAAQARQASPACVLNDCPPHCKMAPGLQLLKAQQRLG